jgi:alpha-mannosidase
MKRRTFLCALPAAGLARGQAAQPLYLVTYDHGGVILWGAAHFLDRLRDAISWLKRYPHFKIGLDNETYLYDYLAEHEPAALEELRGYLQRFPRRFGIGTCTYGQPLSCFINEESNIRQLQYGIETARRRLGRAPEIYLMSEHAMHSQLPQILRGLGFRAAIMRTHFMMYGYNPTFDVPYGWWIGLDGSRIPAVPTYPGEGAEFGATTYDNWVLTRCPGPECRGSLEEFRRRFAHIHPLIATRADDAGLRREDLVRMTEQRNDCRWMLLEDLPGILPEPAADMKTAPNDFVVRMPWGYCGNEIFDRTRQAEISVLTAERLAAIESLAGGEAHEGDLETAWKNLLVAQHHDIQICGLLPDARRFTGASLAASARVAAASLRATAARMRGGTGGQIAVFNPSSWRRKEWIEAIVTLPPRFATGLEVRHGGQLVPSALASALRGSSGSLQQTRLLLLADLPALGVASYSISPAVGQESTPAAGLQTRQPLHIETPLWLADLHPDGGIASLRSRQTGAPVLAPGKRSAFFAALVNGRPAESLGRWRFHPRTEDLPFIEAYEQGELAGLPYRCDLRLWAHSPRLDYRVRFEFNGEKIGRLSNNPRDAVSPFIHEDKLRFKVYPAAAGALTGVRDLPFAIAETPTRCIDGNYWTALAGSTGGLAFFNRGAMGAVREEDGGFSLPLAYSMYYVWGTRILDGEYTWEFALWPFTTAWKEADLHRRALEYSFSPAVLAGDPGDGSLGDLLTPIEFSSDDVLATALYPKEGRVHLRMFEHRGAPARTRFACAGCRWEEVDLAGRPLGEVHEALDFHPWHIRTVRTVR